MNRQIILVDWAGAVSITVIWTLAVLRTLVPTSTLRNLLGWLASLGISSKNISFAATKLVWFLVVVAGEVRSAVCWMRVDRMSLQQILRTKSFSSRTFESVNLKHLFSITSSRFLAGLFFPHAASNKSVEHQGDGAGQLEGISIVALDILITGVLVIVVEHTISSLALWVSVWGRFLNIDSVSTIYVVGQNTFLMIGNFVIE